MKVAFIIIGGILVVTFIALPPFYLLLFVGEKLLAGIPLGRGVRFLLIVVKNLRRNFLRTGLTFLATFVLVFVVTMVWSVLHFMDELAAEKTKDIKVIVTEKWQMASHLPMSYEDPLSQGGVPANRPGTVRPMDSMTWQIYFGSTSREKKTREDIVFFIALEPRKLLTMMDEIMDEIRPGGSGKMEKLRPEQVRELEECVAKMERDKRSVIVGSTRLMMLNKKVGDRFSVFGENLAGIDLECEIVGVFPPGRYNEFAVMNRQYLNDAIASYPRTHGGRQHPLADKTLDMVWLQVHDKDEFNKLAAQIDSSPSFSTPAVKCQTLSAAVATQLEGLKSILWGLRWLLAPGILAVMALVLSNAIGISVRERRGEMALLKVMGFQPIQIVGLVTGEAVLLGAIGGFLSTLFSIVMIDYVLVSFTSAILNVPPSALWWGPAMGGLAALLGSLLPAWSACNVKVSDVFARVA